VTAPGRPVLTEHQLHILTLVADGRTHAEIAAEMVLTPKGLTAAVNRAMTKLGARNAPHAVLLACRTGLLDGRPQRHGDHAGYEAHRRRGEDPKLCETCVVGEREHKAALKARQKLLAS
jgi:DNA-binding CsgD family transcriptional regulator